MIHGLTWKKSGFAGVILALVTFFFWQSSSRTPTPAASEELYAFYGLKFPGTSEKPVNPGAPATDSQSVGGPQSPAEAIAGPQLPGEAGNSPQQPAIGLEPLQQTTQKPSSDLPLDALGQISETLTAAQCDEGFPGLYYPIDQSIRHFFLGHTRIGPKDVDISWRSDPSMSLPGGAVRFMIHRNELRILETRGAVGAMGYHDRVQGILNLIQRALNSATAGGEMLPTIEVSDGL